jgi:hypothetical protein
MGNGAEVGYGTSENAVKTQIGVALSVYVLVAIVKKRLRLDASLYTLMQVFGDNIRKIPIQTALSSETSKCDTAIENTNRIYLVFNRTLVTAVY